MWAGLLAVVIVAVAGCRTRVGDLTVVTTRNVNLDSVDLDTKPTLRNVEGRDTVFMFLFIPFGFPHLEDAVDDALDKGNGDVMTDVSIHQGGWWFLVGESYIAVQGDVVRTRERR